MRSTTMKATNGILANPRPGLSKFVASKCSAPIVGGPKSWRFYFLNEAKLTPKYTVLPEFMQTAVGRMRSRAVTGRRSAIASRK